MNQPFKTKCRIKLNNKLVVHRFEHNSKIFFLSTHPLSNVDYCVMCRVKWHEGIDCKAYRELNGYPPEDRAFYNFLKGSRVKKCSHWGYI